MPPLLISSIAAIKILFYDTTTNKSCFRAAVRQPLSSQNFPSRPVLSCPVLSFPTLSSLFHSSLLLFSSLLSSPLHRRPSVQSRLALCYPVPSSAILSHPIPFHLILSYSILSYPITFREFAKVTAGLE